MPAGNLGTTPFPGLIKTLRAPAAVHRELDVFDLKKEI
jgi:hypothetical protein